MTQWEQIQAIQERTDLTYEEAQAVLEEVGGDVINAMIHLERQGKIKTKTVAGREHLDLTADGSVGADADPVVGAGAEAAIPDQREQDEQHEQQVQGQQEQAQEQAQEQEQQRQQAQGQRRPAKTLKDMFTAMGRLALAVVDKGNTNFLHVRRGEDRVTEFPLTVVVLMTAFLPWVTLVLVLVGAVLSCRCRFVGPDFKETMQ